jgi:pyruvate/2-oxoglutarate/acetoin dehydrogenase E1 component/TPP-dependent pyruvate/acetoin dehydrogenase alpha subunit
MQHTETIANPTTKTAAFQAEDVLQDYKIALESRHASLVGRKEVFSGKAKFGIFGDGKELPQIAMAKVFQKGDFRSGYYRDQTFMFAVNELNLEQYFAQLYAHPDLEADPSSAGRCMNSHFSTRSLDQNGKWKNLMEIKNSAADISPTAGQMPRLVGLAQASKLYRQNPDLQGFTNFSNKGNEIAFGTIGNASTSEGLFYEAINAAGVLQVPLLMSVWDDEYGISVGKEHHTTKHSISKALAGFQRTATEEGYEILVVKGWDYVALCETYQKAAQICREQHVPVLVHVTELTQPQGHSTSGSHERYKSKERLAWEAEFDCIKQFRKWIIAEGFATAEQLDVIEEDAKKTVNNARNRAWKAFADSTKLDIQTAIAALNQVIPQSKAAQKLTTLKEELEKVVMPTCADGMAIMKKALRELRFEPQLKQPIANWVKNVEADYREKFSSHLYSQSDENIFSVPTIPAVYDENSPVVDGREVLNAAFDNIFKTNPLVVAFGEDVGKIGDVNQGFAGLQAKYGELRISDTGIREATIIGQAIGLAMRGLRPIAEIQYLDYLLYGIQILSDDVACLQYRTKGGQKCPLIVRTRGHRLEGIWHSGSPIGMILNTVRGMRVAVPRNMTQAAGFYNTLLQADEPAIVIECLNGYRLKEKVPANLAEFTVPFGVPEILRVGEDVTIVTYGSMCRIVMEAARQLAEVGISVEVIDVQTLLPFDVHHSILASIQKTNRVIFADEDVSGGATGFMMAKVLDEQNAYRWLDSQPVCISGQDHRPAYGSDGDYFSKPNPETVFDKVYAIMHEVNPQRFPSLY